jgi:hypothetical protein
MEVFLFRQSERMRLFFPLSKWREIFVGSDLVKNSTSQGRKKEKKMVSFLDFGMMTARLAI